MATEVRYLPENLLAHDQTTVALEKLSDTVDLATFEQILEMDDDESDREFSSSIVFGFFEQAETTFDTIEKAMYVVTPFLR